MAAATRRIEMCVSDIHTWMALNKLKLNTDKTELLYLHPNSVHIFNLILFNLDLMSFIHFHRQGILVLSLTLE